MLLRYLHFYGGLFLLLIFLLSGQYMDHGFNHLEGMEDVKRIIFRAEHIYLLLSSLIHIGLGSYIAPHSSRILYYLQLFASSLMFMASVLFIYSFFGEMPTEVLERPFSRMGLYLMLAGVSFHGISTLLVNKVK